MKKVMVKSGENGSGSVPPFLNKCYEMVDDESTDSIISWSKSSNSFIIWDEAEFSLRLLPKHFKHNNFSSFIRQLNIYGFRKIDTDKWEFANDRFVRGQKHLLKTIRRRKYPHKVDEQKTVLQQDDCDEPSKESAKDGLWGEIENLKTDKNALTQELVKLRQFQDSADNKLLLLSNRLQGMEKHQQQMLSFLVMTVQGPGFLVQLLQPKENNWHMDEAGNMLDLINEDDKPVASDGMIIKYTPPIGGKRKPVAPLSSGFDEQPEPELSADGLKDLCISSEFLKVLMDEKLCPLETYSPFLLPDLPDDGSWEQLLLSSPFRENIEDSYQESEKPTVSGMEIAATTIFEIPNENTQSFESLIAEMEKTQESGLESCVNGVHLESMQSLESLTEQMEFLASEMNNREGRN